MIGRWLDSRRRDLKVRPAASEDRRTMARAQAYLWGSGGTLVLISLSLTRAPGTNVAGLVACSVLAYTVAAIQWRGQEWVPVALLSATVALGSVVITLLMWFDGSLSSVYALFYVWAALYAFYFFSPRIAALHGVVIAVVSGVELVLRESAHPPAGRWLIIVGTVTVAGVWTQQLVRRVRWLVRVDSLTGVANRRHLDAELPGIMSAARRAGTSLSVVNLDLDFFKAYNDELGHPAGDRHLRQTATAWEAQLRPGDLIARAGGEEFAVVLPGCDEEAALQVAERMRLATPNGQTCSVGVAIWDRLESPEELLDRADGVLYEAKLAGRNRTIVSIGGQFESAPRPKDWATSVAEAIDRRAVRSVYQPIVSLEGKEVHGVEALARPLDLSTGASVDEFFVAAQRVGAVRDIDWLCRRAALEGARVLGKDETVFINVALGALLSPLHDVDQMLLLLRSVERSPTSVVLEITEREALADTVRMAEVLAAYRAEGFRFAIDDVGEGHSTIEVLAGCCPEYIKLARSVCSTLNRMGSRAAVRAIVAFGAESGAEVIAEGIESQEQADEVRALGVRLGQGFLYASPAWPEQLLAHPLMRDRGLAPRLSVVGGS